VTAAAPRTSFTKPCCGVDPPRQLRLLAPLTPGLADDDRRRLAIDAHRARRARPQETELTEDFEFVGGQPAHASVDEVGLRAALVALPRSQYQVLTEIYYRDQSVAETARLLQIPPGTVRSRTFYGVRTLRRALAAGDAAA
jgi:DNA-directed RNA polymerase specialized sigma24 family protein